MDKLIFPLNTGKISWSMKTGQEWTVTDYVSASGARKTLCQQELPKWSMEVKFPCLTKHEVDLIKSFYVKCKGSWRPFYYKDYEQFEVSYTVDKDILGGLVIRIGDRVVDSSIRNKLNSMAQNLYKIHIS